MSITLVFDLDDTLYLESDFVRSGIAAVDHWARTELGIEGLGAAATRLWDGGCRKQLFDAALQHLGEEAEPCLVAVLVAVYRNHEPDICLAPDARRFLERGHGVRLALISDGWAETQRRKIDALRLAQFGFDPIICTDVWGQAYWKPHQRAFETVEAAYGGVSDRFLYIADNPAKDFVAPRALGWGTIQVDRAGAIHPRHALAPDQRAHAAIRSLDELTMPRIAQVLEGARARSSA